MATSKKNEKKAKKKTAPDDGDAARAGLARVLRVEARAIEIDEAEPHRWERIGKWRWVQAGARTRLVLTRRDGKDLLFDLDVGAKYRREGDWVMLVGTGEELDPDEEASG